MHSRLSGLFSCENFVVVREVNVRVNFRWLCVLKTVVLDICEAFLLKGGLESVCVCVYVCLWAVSLSLRLEPSGSSA